MSAKFPYPMTHNSLMFDCCIQSVVLVVDIIMQASIIFLRRRRFQSQKFNKNMTLQFLMLIFVRQCPWHYGYDTHLDKEDGIFSRLQVFLLYNQRVDSLKFSNWHQLWPKNWRANGNFSNQVTTEPDIEHIRLLVIINTPGWDRGSQL